MNRYLLTLPDGKTIKLYAKDENSFHCTWNPTSIQLLEDVDHLPLIDEIKSLSIAKSLRVTSNNTLIEKYEFTPQAQNEVECIYFTLYKDLTDNHYYDYCQYQIHKYNQFIVPVTQDMADIKKLHSIITGQKEFSYNVLSHRYYGEPKLSKPKELSNIKQSGSIDFIPAKCKTPFFINGNDIYIKHTDYFSALWQPPKCERVDMPQSYYMKKYFNNIRNEKFVYADNYAGIVLRNEAWIRLKNGISLVLETNASQFASIVCKHQSLHDNFSPMELDDEWNRYYEKLHREVMNIMSKNQNGF